MLRLPLKCMLRSYIYLRLSLNYMLSFFCKTIVATSGHLLVDLGMLACFDVELVDL